MTQIADRLSAIRAEMAKQNLDAFFIPRADEYLGEYIPAHNERMLWASNFTGSAGMVVILKDRAAMFVDGRYTVQVRQQAPAEYFEYYHLIDHPHVQWVVDQVGEGARIGCDTKLHNRVWYNDAAKVIAKGNAELVEVAENPVDLAWAERPAPGKLMASLHAREYTGMHSLEKRQQIGEAIAAEKADVAYIAQPDSICWLLNIRGQDTPCLPIVLGTSLLWADGSMVHYLDADKLPEGVAEHVGDGVTFKSETELQADLQALSGKAVMVDPVTANAWSQLTLERAGASIVAAADPALMPKACKNGVELEGAKAAHVRDAVAVTKFLAWIDSEVAKKASHTEATLSDQLLAFRKELPEFVEPSFDTISATGPNGAMCHYNHLDGKPAELVYDSLYLVDSGAQYPDGTTDITRTVAIGNVTGEHKKMFTLVLKGHIALDQQRFPEGTTGAQLDAIARQFLWQEGFDYDHGTGHGVGSFLSVHEGPQRIGKGVAPVVLKPGMILSNEPGYYKENAYGIRCENLVIVRRMQSEGDLALLGFEPITLVPFDTRLIDVALLTEAELSWVNRYHAKVRETLQSRLSGDTLEWMVAATEPLTRQ